MAYLCLVVNRYCVYVGRAGSHSAGAWHRVPGLLTPGTPSQACASSCLLMSSIGDSNELECHSSALKDLLELGCTFQI